MSANEGGSGNRYSAVTLRPMASATDIQHIVSSAEAALALDVGTVLDVVVHQVLPGDGLVVQLSPQLRAR